MTGFASKRKAAQNKDMTDWFPVTINPVHIGVYEVSNNVTPISFAKWDGEKWCAMSSWRQDAECQTRRGWAMYTGQGSKWRGFKNEQ